jgi:hypothetical protein
LLEDSDYRRTLSRYPRTLLSVQVIAWRGDERLGLFEINGDALHVPGYGTFQCSKGEKYILPGLRRVLPYGRRMENVIQRCDSLQLAARVLEVHILSREHPFASVRDGWCDALLEFASTHVEETASRLQEEPHIFGPVAIDLYVDTTLQMARECAAEIEQALAPDSKGIRRWPIGLSSGYGDDPPDDAILVFETDPGWNKAGGPELLGCFTDPDGCFVYVNDHGVTFLGKEQVEQIRLAAQRARQQNRPFELRLSTLLEAIEVEQ